MDWKLEVVVLPISDVDTAKKFYADACGFTVDHDTRVSDTARVVQLTPPGSACSVVFGTGLTQATPGSMQGLQLTVTDIDAAREHLAGRGVPVSGVQHFANGVRADGPGGDWNSFLFFADPDGNSWAVQQSPPR
jgi:catechol 2,3-dioxygenase-like lactoylglutathione lyase family enzyme